MISPKMDLIILNLVLMPHKFGVNASNLVLMPKKTGSGSHYNFFLKKNNVLRKTGRTSGEPTRRTPSIFLKYDCRRLRPHLVRGLGPWIGLANTSVS
jgi:hypothetical protein